jgi:hypothetical protein
VHAVSACADRGGEGSRTQTVRNRARRDLAPLCEHAIEGGLIVEAEDQDRQVLAQSAQIDGQVRRERGLADAALVAGDGDDAEGAVAVLPVFALEGVADVGDAGEVEEASRASPNARSGSALYVR